MTYNEHNFVVKSASNETFPYVNKTLYLWSQLEIIHA